MKKIKLNIFIVFGFILLLNSCQSAKEGLLGGKRGNTDEFLVEKKNPLVVPPKFNQLPKPKTSGPINEIEESTEVSMEDKIKKEIAQNKNSENKEIGNKSIEESIIEEINNN